MKARQKNTNTEPLGVSIQSLKIELGGKPILEDLTANIPAGSSTAVVGVSGKGKSTLLRAIGGLGPAPSEGSIEIGGLPPSSHHPLRSIWFLFQEAVLFPNLTVINHLRTAFSIREFDVDHDRIIQILRKVGLESSETFYPYELSVGMRARLAVAMSFCVPPSVMLADEPFASLDAQYRKEMNGSFGQLQHEFGSTLIWVTHEIVDALKHADHILVVGGTPAKVIESIDLSTLPAIENSARLPDDCLKVYNRITSFLESDRRQP